MAYGTVKVDNITFDNGGSDQNVTVSGLYRATTSGVTLSGTIAATTVSGVTVIGSTTVSGATVTGTTANFTSGNFGNIISSAATMSGALIMANQQQVRFREAVGNGVNHIALQAPAIVSADQTITLPDETGTVVTTGDNGSVTSTMILDGTILNVDINASAGIVDTKLATIATAGKVSNSATTATNANTASAIVARDASGNFTAGTITAALTGAASSNVLKAGDTMTGVLAVTAGTAALPGLAIASDPNTGIFSPGADQLAISTNGTGRLFVASDGRVLHNHSGAVATNPFSSSHVPRLVTTSTETSNYQGLASIAYNGSFAGLWLGRSAGTTVNTVNALTAGNVIGGISFAGADGTAFINAARITCIVDGAVSTNTVPGALFFATSASGTSPTERLRITSTGNVGIGTSSPGVNLHVNSAGNTELEISSTFADSISTGLRINTTGNSSVGRVVFQKAGTSRGQIRYSHNATAASEFLGFNVAGGSDKLVIDGSGQVGIGTTSPGELLHVEGNIRIGGLSNKLLSNGQVIIEADADNNNASNSDIIFQRDGGQESARIDSSGRLLVGTSTTIAAGAWLNSTATQSAFQHQVAGLNWNEGSVGLFSYETGANAAPQISFNKSISNTLGTFGTALSANTDIGSIVFSGSDGTKFVLGALIAAEVDGTSSANDMPGRLVFSTTADGAASPTERLRITSAGVFQVADAGNITVGTTTGTKIGTATTQKLGFYNATPVVQPTAVADATDAATVITQLNALLTRMRNLGLIAT
jgi:hypothetical protein